MFFRRSFLFLVCSVVAAMPLAGQGFGVPKSNKLIEAELYLPGGEKVQLSAREGTMVTIRYDAEGDDQDFFYGLSPALMDESGDAVGWLVLEIQEEHGRQRLLQRGEPLMQQEILTPGTIPTPIGDLDVLIQGISEGHFKHAAPSDPLAFRPAELQRLFGRSGGGTCCVSCGSWTICGDSVRLGCGSCDSGPPSV